MTFSRKGIKNYKARVSSIEGYSQRIQYALSRVGAKRVFFEYDGQGRMAGVGFIIGITGGDFPVSLPARIEKVAQIMYGNGLDKLSDSQKDQAYTTAWANIKDWVEAQCALIETEMVKVQEVFLPYMTAKNGQSFFEVLEQQRFEMYKIEGPKTEKIEEGQIE